MKLTAIINGIAALLTANLLAEEPPPNDNFAQATPLSFTTSITVEGSTECATPGIGDPDDDAGHSLWYVWTAPSSGRIKISAVSHSPKKGYILISDDVLTAHDVAQGVLYRANTVTLYVVQGITYHLCIGDRIPGYINTHDPFTLGIAYDEALPAATQYVEHLSNDNFDDALADNKAKSLFVLYTRNATFEPFEQEFLDKISGLRYSTTEDGGVWINWTAPVTGTAKVTTKSAIGASILILILRGESIDSIKFKVGGSNGAGFVCRQGKSYKIYILSQG